MKEGDGSISSNSWKNTGNEAAVVIEVEHYLKTNISTWEDIADDNAENLEWIIKNIIAFFCGAERGKGALYVTGVETCALRIWARPRRAPPTPRSRVRCE